MEYVSLSEYCREHNLIIDNFLKNLLAEDERTCLAFIRTNYGYTPIIYEHQFKIMKKYH